MKELKVGMYVRTHNGFISKIIEVKREPISGNEIILIKGNYKGNKDEEYGYVRDYYKKGTSFVYRGEIKEVSENIIDLIEVGDYVNGLRINSITEADKNNDVRLVWHINTWGDDDISFSNEEIKSILTKEQFDSVRYEVEK